MARLSMSFNEYGGDTVRALPGEPTPIISARDSACLCHAIIYPTDAECEQIIGVLQAHLDCVKSGMKPVEATPEQGK
jgi:hypothetical protein